MANRTVCAVEGSGPVTTQFNFVEALEDRILLANAAPTFATALSDAYFMPEAKDSGGNYVLSGGLRTFTARTIGIDGADADGDALTITAVSDNPDVTTYIPTGNRYARLHFVASDGTTVIGDVVVQLFDADGRAPLAADRFITLATKYIDPTTKTPTAPTTAHPAFYTNVVVHRVIPGFMIQTGDAANGDGTGGSPLGYFNSPSPWPNLSFAGAGVLAMAHSSDVNTNDSQFFITDGPTAWLNNVHEIFGQVISGMDVVEKVINVQRDNNDRPYNPPELQSVQIFSSTQDATVTVYAADGFSGVAHVTVTLDDNHGGVTTKVITIRPLAWLGDRPTITTDSVTSMTAGVNKVITPTYVDDGAQPMSYTIETSNSLVTASVDPATGQITLTAPASFSGLLQYRVTAVESGWADLTPTGFTGSVYVHATTEVPYHASTLSSYSGGSSYALGGASIGNTVLVANNGKGLARYDLSDPANPVKTAELTTGFSGARNVQVVGTTAYVADTWNGFEAYDVSAADKITRLGSAVATGGAAVNFALSGSTAWVADYSNGVTAVDIANPSAMTKIGSFKTWGSVTIKYIVDVAVSGNRLYASDSAGYILVLDITDKTNPKFINYFSAGASPWGIHMYGASTVLLTDSYALRIWDLSNPMVPRVVSQTSIPGAWQVEVRSSLAVVTGGTGFAFVDLTNIAKPRIEYTYITPNQGGTAFFAGPNVVLSDGSLGFAVLDAARTITNAGSVVLSANGVSTTVTLAGGGTAHIGTTDTAPASLADIDIVGGTKSTTLKITTAGGALIAGGDVDVQGSLKSLTASSLNLQGDLNVTGSLEALTLHGVSGGHTFTVAATDPSKNPLAVLTLNLGVVSDLAITSAVPLSSLTATSWTSLLGAPDSINAASLGTLTVKGPFEADLTLTGNSVVGKPTLGKATISGAVPGTNWHVHGSAGAITINGAVGTVGTAWTLDQATTVASLTLGNVGNGVVDASGAVGAVKAVRWANGSIHADTLASLSITGLKAGPAGDFGADLTLDGPVDPTKPTVGNVTVAGGLTGGVWTITGKVGKVSIHDVEAALNLPAASLAAFTSASPMVKVTILGVPAYLLAVGDGGTLYKLQFGSLTKWPVTALTQAVGIGDPTPASTDILAALTLKSLKNQFVSAGLGAWTPTAVLKPGLLASFTKSTDPLSTTGANAKVAYIYDNALAIGALLDGTPDAESLARAFQIADAFVLLQNRDPMNAAAVPDGTFATLTPAALRDGYGYGVVAATRTAPTVTVRDVGTNNTSTGNQAFVAMALLNAADAADAAGGADNLARAADYRTTAKELLLYVGRQRASAPPSGGFSMSGDPVNGSNRSTEHNIDLAGALAVMADGETDAALKTQWQTWQASAETFRAAMYGVNPNFASIAAISDAWSYFAAGANAAGTVDRSLIPIDTGAWSSLGLGDNNGVAFDFLEFLATSTDAAGRTYTGFDPGFRAVADPGVTGQRDGVGTEATAYMALLAQKLGDAAVLAALPDRATLTAAEQSAFDAVTAAANAGATDHDLADYFTRQLADIQLYAPNANTLGLVASPVKGTGTGEYTLINGISLAATCWARFVYTGWNVLSDSAV